MDNGINRPQKVTQSHWVIKCIRLLARTGRWTEVSFGFRQLVTGLRGFTPFRYRGLVEFLTIAEDVSDSLGEDQTAH